MHELEAIFVIITKIVEINYLVVKVDKLPQSRLQ